MNIHDLSTRRKREKGSVLIVSFLAFALLFTAGQAFFVRTLNESKLAEIDLSKQQAFYLADGGKNSALVELRQRTDTEITQQVRGIQNFTVFQSYVNQNQPLQFLSDYAHSGGSDPHFTVDLSGNRAFLIVERPNAGTGGYSALLEVFPNGNPSIPQSEVFVFPYRYRISSTGTSLVQGLQQFVQASGDFTITVRRDNFARYALFTDIHTAPGGGIVWFTDRTNFTGPVHSNSRFSFALNPSATFTNGVSQTEQTARYYNRGNSLYLDADRNGDFDVPTFQAGFSRGVAAISLPGTTDQQSQQRVALGLGSNDSIPSLSPGVYIPNSGGVLTGGIYVEGNASQVTLSMDSNNHQIYTVQQGSTTKQILVDPSNNTTTVTQSGIPTTYAGKPNGMVYVNGVAQSVSGTVSNETQVTIASTSDLQITNHLRYQNYSTTPTLNATGANNILGLLSWNGNVRITTSAPNDLHVHGTAMAPNGVFTVDNYNRGSPRGTVNLLGGVITENYGAFGTFNQSGPVSGYGRNFVHDGRMLQGFSPPYFPTITLFAAFNNGAGDLPAWDKTR